MILKDLIHVVWTNRQAFHITLWKYAPSVLLGDENLNNTHVSRDAEAASWFHLLFWTNTSTPLELVTQYVIVIWILWSSYSFRFLEQSVLISSSIPVRKVPYQFFYLEQHILHPVLQMWMSSNFGWYNMINSMVAKMNYDANKTYK